MTLKMSDDGIKDKLEKARAAWNGTALRLHLFQNNLTPTTNTVIGDFTEATFAGYAAVDIITWSAPSVAAHVATIGAAVRTFTRSTTGAGQTIYGYYVTNNGDTILWWSERDPNAPITLTNAGDSYSVTVALTDQDIST